MNTHVPLTIRMAERLCADGGYVPSPADIEKAKLCLIDYLACALTAHDLPWSRQAISLARDLEPSDATIIGTNLRTTVPDAAFANSVLGHGLVRDDMHVGSVSHLGVVVMPAVLALAEREHSSGAELLAAIIAGYEAGGKLGRAVLDVEVSRTHRPTGIVGAFAAAAAGARLLRLPSSAVKNSLALAANLNAGFNEWAATGGSEMFFHPAFAVRNGLTCIALARSGAHFSDTALDGPAGLLASFSKLPAPEFALPYDDGAEIGAVFFKEVPACNYAQTPAQAARAIAVEEGLAVEDIDIVNCRVNHAAMNYPGCNFAGPFAYVLQAKMSIQYNVASALVHASFAEENYHPEQQKRVTDLAERVSLEVGDDLTAAYPERQAAEVSVTTKAGRMLQRTLPDVLAADPELVRKRYMNAAEASLGSTPAQRLLDTIDDLESCENAGTVAGATRNPLKA